MLNRIIVEKPIHNRIVVAKPKIGVAGKTGTWRTEKPLVDNSKCKKCYQCEIFCPVNVIRVDPNTGATVDYDYCKGCGICAELCPFNAIRMEPE
ncbi:MAG: ferredoxin [Thermoprotei archaeon]|nr:MAG: ferredoxin [Thermoprotei archaeon]